MKKLIAEIITEEAWQAFEAWVREHDPDGSMDVLDQATAYCMAEQEAGTARQKKATGT